MTILDRFSIRASDVTGQRQVNVGDVRSDTTVGELLDGLVPRMQLPRINSSGEPLVYEIRHDREGRHLNRAERVGDALSPDDKLTIQPRIDAGSNSLGRGR